MPVVLIVEDDTAILNVLDTFLQLEGYTTIPANDGYDGLSKLGTSRVDVILVDLRMPRLSGFEFIEAVRENPGYASIPIIAISVYNSMGFDWRSGGPHALADLRSLPVQAFLPKPFDLNEVRLAIQQNCK